MPTSLLPYKALHRIMGAEMIKSVILYLNYFPTNRGEFGTVSPKGIITGMTHNLK